jgi:hypothetical protein
LERRPKALGCERHRLPATGGAECSASTSRLRKIASPHARGRVPAPLPGSLPQGRGEVEDTRIFAGAAWGLASSAPVQSRPSNMSNSDMRHRVRSIVWNRSLNALDPKALRKNPPADFRDTRTLALVATSPRIAAQHKREMFQFTTSSV